MLEEKRPGLYETKMATVLQTEEKWKRTKVKKDKCFTVESYPRKTSSRLNVSHRACQHAQDTQICQVDPERERILAEMLDTVCKVPSGAENMLI